MLKPAVRIQLCHLLIAENIRNIPVGSRAGAALVNSTTDRFSQVPRKGRVRKEEAGVWACPIKVGVIQLLIRLENCEICRIKSEDIKKRACFVAYDTKYRFVEGDR